MQNSSASGLSQGTSGNNQTQGVANNISNINITNSSPRTIWGKVIIYLREHHAVALHIACGDITDVEYKDEVFYINTSESFLYELLKSEDNTKDLKDALNFFGIQKFEIVKKDKKLTVAQQDLNILKSIFGDKLLIE